MLQYLLHIRSICLGLATRAGAAVCDIIAAVMTEKKMNCMCDHAVHLPDTIQHHAMNGIWKMFSYLLMMMLLITSINAQAVTPPGTAIDNIATASFEFSAATGSAVSNTETTVTTIIQTPSTVSLFQFDSTGTSSFTVPVVTQHSTDASGTVFVPSADPAIPLIGGGATVLNPADPQPLNPVTLYSTGEPVFVQVDDQDQNLDPAVLETVRVIVLSSTGDQEELILTETGVDTGIFVGYVQSSSTPVTQFDGLLSLGEETTVTVQYTDQFDPTDVSTGGSLVDPFGVVFSSNDGTLLDGAIVSILDSSGNAANVFGDDGVSTYPNTVVTGGSATDSGGTVVNFPEGDCRFTIFARRSLFIGC